MRHRKEKIFDLARPLGLGGIWPLVTMFGNEEIKGQFIEIINSISFESASLCKKYYGVECNPMNIYELAKAHECTTHTISLYLKRANREMQHTELCKRLVSAVRERRKCTSV